MTTVYLIRHAQAEGNLYRRCQGHFDGRITPRGRKQIDALMERFRDVPIDAVYASDLTRTQVTAQAILRTHPGLTLHIEPRLQEVGMGAWENQPWGNMERDTPEQVEYFSTDPARWHAPGGESFQHLGDRMVECVTELARRHEGQTIALVSHGMAIRTLLCRLKGLASHEVSQVPHGDNTAVHTLSWDGEKLTVLAFNDNSHLPPELSPFSKQNWWKDSKGSDRHNLSFRPLDPERDKERYEKSYADCWRCAHGDLTGFVPGLYWTTALERAGACPEAVAVAEMAGEFAGIVELDTARGAEQGLGWISLFYLTPENRSHGLGIQLLGQSVAVYRNLGRHRLCLHVAPDNAPARRFYEKYGFARTGEDPGATGPLLRLERELELP